MAPESDPRPNHRLEATHSPEEYVESLRLVLQKLDGAKSQGLLYAVVGGTALAAFSNEPYSPLRENNTPRDLDILILEDPNRASDSIQRAAEAQSERGQVTVPTNFNRVQPETYNPNFQMLGRVKKTSNGYTLVFRKIEFELPNEVMATVRTQLNTTAGILEMDTLSPNTLLHLYIDRIGSIKPKDAQKLRIFAQTLSRSGAVHFSADHSKYEVFHSFAKAMKEEYPVYVNALRLFTEIDQAIFGSLIAQKLIPERILKYLTNI
jgi:hypothetical protein